MMSSSTIATCDLNDYNDNKKTMTRFILTLCLFFSLALNSFADVPTLSPDVLLPPSEGGAREVRGGREARYRSEGDRTDADRQRFNFEEYLDKKCSTVVGLLQLNAEESARFVPLYRELQQKKSNLFKRYGGGRHVRMQIERGEQVADTTYMRVVNNLAARQIEDAKLDQQYLELFAKILTPRQLYLLQTAEQNFRTDMMRRGNGRHDDAKAPKPMKK